MVICSCQKPIEKIPSWMEGINVEFVCNNCPNRQMKNIAFVDLDAGLKNPGKPLEEDDAPLPEAEDEDEPGPVSSEAL